MYGISEEKLDKEKEDFLSVAVEINFIWDARFEVIVL